MIIVTGGAGFIGSNLIHTLNAQGHSDILLVDDLTNGHKMHNIADLTIADYMDKRDFLASLANANFLPHVSAVFHQGACSATTEWNGQYVMENNYAYSKQVFHWCQQRKTPFIYASSASVYGMGKQGFCVDRACEKPINMYAYSKFQFDQYVRQHLPQSSSQIVGLRYFNVYGPREQHKGSMSSTAYHFNTQLQQSGQVKLFAGCDGYVDGQQERDFVYVNDVVAINLWFLEHPHCSGIFNVGTGQAQTFNAMAQAVIDWHGRGEITYIPFPEQLRGAYQSYTQADLSTLRAVGCHHEFLDVKAGVKDYLDRLNHHA
ncbi:MAG TPA: ADP-glyceromanno-heptose 6-epimerase [Methylococcaceae bacterium]|nr:ADP-glyceromanno-heptose 6-epimerase [Methylococcaceae bacterium]